jgi:hypothetical protein
VTAPPRFVLIDTVAGGARTVDAADVVDVVARATDGPDCAVGVCGHAGFRVPDPRVLLPVLEGLTATTGGPVALHSTLLDARHSSDDRRSSPLRVHVEVVKGNGGVDTARERLRIATPGDPYVSQIPFGPPSHRETAVVSHRTMLEVYRKVVSGDAYRWVSPQVVAAATRTLERGGKTLLDFHAKLRDVVFEQQLAGIAGLELVPTVATAFGLGHTGHILLTHQGQVACAVDLLEGEEHAQDVFGFFGVARHAAPHAPLPRWLFSPVEPIAYFCRGMSSLALSR